LEAVNDHGSDVNGEYDKGDNAEIEATESEPVVELEPAVKSADEPELEPEPEPEPEPGLAVECAPIAESVDVPEVSAYDSWGSFKKIKKNKK
jgi:hypothetical protein